MLFQPLQKMMSHVLYNSKKLPKYEKVLVTGLALESMPKTNLRVD